MSKTCSIREVARQAQVAASTVSRILNNRDDAQRITDATRSKVLAIAEALNYSPNVNAKRLFSRKTGIIGLLVPSYRKMGQHIFEDTHLTRIISGLEYGLGDAGYNLLMIFNNEEFVQQKSYLSLFRGRQIDGLLIWGAYENEDYWAELLQEKYPCLFLTTIPKLDIPVNFVAADYERAGYLAAKHLLEKGHRQFAWIGGDDNSSVTSFQRRGCQQACAEYGVDFDLMPIRFGGYFADSAEAHMAELLKSGCAFTAVIAANIKSSRGISRVANTHNLSIPEQIAIISLDSIWDDEIDYSITRIRMSDLDIGKAAAAGMSGLIENRDMSIKVKIPVELYMGQST